MSQVYNPEADVIAEIERLELEARESRRRIEHVKNAEDRRVLNRMLGELRDQIEYLRRKLP
jgi:urease accessory protein UreE